MECITQVPYFRIMLSKDEIERYCRQMILPGVGGKGQERLKEASVLVVGAGGLGCPVGLYLAAAGVGHLGVLDYDVVEVSNLHRQVAHSEAARGLSKVTSLATTLHALNSTIRISEHNRLLDSTCAMDIINGYDIIVDATDNVATRYLLNDCVALLQRHHPSQAPKALVSGAALGLEGQLTTYCWRPDAPAVEEGAAIGGPCYRCLFPQPPPPETVTNCDMGGVLGPIPGMIGCMQAFEVIRIITQAKPNYAGRMFLFSGETGDSKVARLRARRPDCAVCGPDGPITHLIDYVQFCGSGAHDKGKSVHLIPAEKRITVLELSEVLLNKTPITIVDVRSDIHTSIYTLPGTITIPLSKLEPAIRNGIIPQDRPVICLCRRGNDSQRAVVLFQRFGIEAKDVIGGLHEYSRLIDNNIPIY